MEKIKNKDCIVYKKDNLVLVYTPKKKILKGFDYFPSEGVLNGLKKSLCGFFRMCLPRWSTKVRKEPSDATAKLYFKKCKDYIKKVTK